MPRNQQYLTVMQANGCLVASYLTSTQRKIKKVPVAADDCTLATRAFHNLGGWGEISVFPLTILIMDVYFSHLVINRNDTLNAAPPEDLSWDGNMGSQEHFLTVIRGKNRICWCADSWPCFLFDFSFNVCYSLRHSGKPNC